jgi:hypothetical protein
MNPASKTQQRVGSLDPPAFAIAPQRTAIPIRFAHPLCLVRNDRLNTLVSTGVFAPVAVICLVCNSRCGFCRERPWR